MLIPSVYVFQNRSFEKCKRGTKEKADVVDVRPDPPLKQARFTKTVAATFSEACFGTLVER